MNHSHLHNNVPHLHTFITGPLRHLEKLFLENQAQIEDWLKAQWQHTPPPLTASVDLRNAGFKLAPIDTNLFPAGFNNLTADMMPLSIQAAQSTLENNYPGCKNILLIPEGHTRNIFYFENIVALQNILIEAGYDTRIGSLSSEITTKMQHTLPSGRNLVLEPAIREQDKLVLQDFTPCLIMLNNDLSEGIPESLQNLEQPISPPLNLGWANRLKSGHFKHYQQISEEFADLLQMDSWLINPLFRNCGEINFQTREGEDCLVNNVDNLLKMIQRNYDNYGITESPFVIIKADAGTYGMAVMTIESTEQIYNLNRKERARMSAIKGKKDVTKVIIQEGVYTFETVGQDEAVAEPVVYMLGQHVIGGFYRIHTKRGPKENLNAPGMKFEPLAFVTSCNNPDKNLAPNDVPNRFYAYGVVARLALLAAARELKAAN